MFWGDCGTTWTPLSRLSAIWPKIFTKRRNERNALSRALNTLNAPNILEPSNLCRLDGRRRPDDVTVFCVDSLAASNIKFATAKPKGEQQQPMRTAKSQNTATPNLSFRPLHQKVIQSGGVDALKVDVDLVEDQEGNELLLM
ncbi:hypothetical protein ACOME3_002689 [Neoechinorhynchus agilis]